MPNKTINMNNRPHVLSYGVDLVSQDEALAIIARAWQTNNGLHVITLNAEMIIAAKRDPKLDNIIRQANLVIADGAGVVLALKLNGHNIKRLPGIELAQSTLSIAASQKIPVALIGGQTEVLQQLSLTLPKQYPDLNLVACKDGYFKSEDEPEIITNVAQARPQLILVAMGVPRQEYFIAQLRKTMPQAVCIGVGGSFDIWAGKKKRAPVIFQSCHLEWLYRLLSEPWRFKRMSMALPEFAAQVIIEHWQKKLSVDKRKDQQD